jgi:molybdenum cofactor cytidylyltransferase
MCARVGLILLAAGASTRLGSDSPKQLLNYQGKTLLRHAVETACASQCVVKMVVLGAQHERFERETVGLDMTVCVNSNWQEGMGSSLRVGLESLLVSSAGENLTGVMVMLCDQPLLTTARLDSLISAHSETPEQIIASDYGERYGVPCLFPATFFPELLALSGDEGARQLLRKCKDNLVSVAFPEGNFDIDTFQDWQHLESV